MQTDNDEIQQNLPQSDPNENQYPTEEVQQLQIDSEEPIFINVSNPSEVKVSQMNKYLVYTIKGKDAFGPFEVQRRFNEFYILRETLLATWPGLYIPPIPEKSVNPSGEELLERVRLLNIFVMKMSQIKYLYYSEEFSQIFLRSNNGDCCKSLQGLPKPNVKSQIDKYKHIFEIDQFTEPDQNSLGKITTMQQFCKRQQALLIKLYEQAKMLSMSKRYLKDQFHVFFGFGLYELEQLILKPCVENENSLVYSNPQAQELKSTLNYLKDQQSFPLDKIQDLITTEQRDMEAFLQGFQTRESLLAQKTKIETKLKEHQELLTKVMSGKVNPFGKSQDETRQKLELQIVECQNDADSYKFYYQLVTYVLSMKAIEKFKKDKHESYRKIIKEIAQQENEHNQVMTELWARTISFIESLQ